MTNPETLVRLFEATPTGVIALDVVGIGPKMVTVETRAGRFRYEHRGRIFPTFAAAQAKAIEDARARVERLKTHYESCLADLALVEASVEP